jgi:hypothetical protein
MSNKLNINQFSYKRVGYGQYEFTYTIKSGKEYTSYSTNSEIFDFVFNSDEPKQKNLKILRNICKQESQ